MTPDTLIDNTYEPCAQCGAPLDDAQRYCVFCGASRHHAADPVARYLAAARQRPGASPPAPPPASSARSERWLIVAIALLPIAAAIGVLAGRSSGGSEDVIAALRAQKAPVVQVGAATGDTTLTAASNDTATAAATKSFPLAKGFTVELRTLPAKADGAAVTAATKAAESKGATGVGVLDPAAVDVRPDPGNKLVVYSGAFATRSKAEKALAKLKHDFPDAKVVAVSRREASDESIDAPVAKHPTAAQKTEGAKIVKEIQATKGKKYVDQQRKLPDTIVVP